MSNTPASPIPWHDGERHESKIDIHSIDGSRIGTLQPPALMFGGYEEMDKNAKYMMHTANAYPKLIKFLQDCETGEHMEDKQEEAIELLNKLLEDKWEL